MKKKWMIMLLAAAVGVSLTGCKKEEQKQTEAVTEITADTEKETEKATEKQTEEPTEAETQAAVQTEAAQPETESPVQTESTVLETEIMAQPSATSATLYIGYDGSFQEYPFETTETITPEALVQGIADLTGWDLTLADMITSGKGGMTVCFSSQSALFTGPPAQQKEEFHVYDTYQLVSTILDSIQRTLQYYYVNPELGDPSNLDIYYCMEGYQPLTIPGIDVTVPLEEPYHGLS